MKVSYIVSAAIALAMGAAADNCTPNLNYCGSSLLKKGNYLGQIQQALYADNQDPNSDPNHWLFYCVGGESGLIQILGPCYNGCRDNGSGKSDTCL